MQLLKKLKDFFGPSASDRFYEAFEQTAKTRGCVCFFQEATETKTNGAGIVEKYAVEGTATKLVLLPGDPYPAVNKKNLVAFEGLNRQYRRELLKIREQNERRTKTQAA